MIVNFRYHRIEFVFNYKNCIETEILGEFRLKEGITMPYSL